MQSALKFTGKVQPGGRVEVSSPQLPSGQDVDIIVVLPQKAEATRRSVVDVLTQAPGHLAFQTAEEVDDYVQAERDTWER